MYYRQFSKNFPLPKNGGHFEVLPKMQKHNFIALIHLIQWTIAYLVGADRAISSKFSTHMVSKKCTIGNFLKNFHVTKNGAHFEFFEFLPKMEKHKFASISLTVRDRAILLKFSTHRVSKKCTTCIGNFQKFSSPQK